MERGEHIDEVMRGSTPLLGRQHLGLDGGVEHHAVDVVHHVERRPVHLVVLAEPERTRHGHVGEPHRGDDPVLARHVVRGGEDVAEGWPAHDHAAAVRVGDQERQVRPAAGDQLEREGRLGTRDVGAQPGADRFDLDAVHAATVASSALEAVSPADPVSPGGRRR